MKRAVALVAWFTSARAGSGAGSPLRHALAVAAVALFAACGGDGGPLQAVPDPNGSIRGTVTDDTGATVADAAVVLSGNGQAARTTTSDADGVYTFADVPPGTYTLAITPPAGFTIGTAGTASVTVASGAQANASAIVLNRAAADSCAITPGSLRPDFGGVATEADRALFAYDVDAPLNLTKTVEAMTANGVEVSAISFSSPGGGSATGMLFDPVSRSGLRPGIVLMHGLPGTARGVAPLAQLLAGYGAVVIAIDAPFARRAGEPVRMSTADRAEQIQLIQDLQRAVDVLRARPNVDAGRIAYLGISYGGAMGALFVGIERRIKAAVLVVGDGGLVSHFTGPGDLSYMAGLPCATRLNWFRAMAPIEPIRFIPHASPTPLLLQSGRLDNLVPPVDAEALHAAAPEPRTILWYDAGHGLNQQAQWDRHDWLHEQIGLDPRP